LGLEEKGGMDWVKIIRVGWIKSIEESGMHRVKKN